VRLYIKPSSVNKAWQGERFKTPKYNRYIISLANLLKPFDVLDGYLQLSLVFGLSIKSADFDNPVKCFVDCLQKKMVLTTR
jgi:Holliday junction resolvase RusA-like endonuclease